jgi:hypothetical protein
MEAVETSTYQGTRACADYVRDIAGRLRFFVTALELAEDEERLPAEAMEGLAEDPDSFVDFRGWYDRQVAETLLTRAADGFLAYLGEILALVYEANPNALPGEANIPVSLGPERQNRGTLVRELAARRVRNLSRKGFDALNQPFRVLRFPLYRTGAERDAIARVLAQRDLIVHSRGVVDRAYRRRVPGSRTPIGVPLALTRTGAVDDALMLMRTAVRVDRAVIRAWGFDTTEIRLGLAEEASGGEI